jgi:hypothetical protein
MTDSMIHTRRLAQFLAMDAMGPAELKQTAEKLPRELAYHDFDGKVQNARELLISEGIQGSTLIPTEILATVLEGSEPAKCFRGVLPMFQMAGQVLKIPYGETGTYAPIVAEGAEIPIESQTYSVNTLTAAKYAVRPMITNEMIEDSLFDIVAGEIRKAGFRLENTLNQVALSKILEPSGSAVDFGGAGANLMANTAKAVAQVQGYGFMPDKIVVHPTFHGAAIGAVSTNYFDAVGGAPYQNGQLGRMLGCDIHMCGVTDDSSTYTWGWGTDNYIGGLVIDSRSAGAIGMRRDISVERFADSIRDMQGMSVSMRFDANETLAYATCRLQY